MTMTDQILTGAWSDVTTIAGALFYAVLFGLGAALLARSIRRTANGLIRRDSHAHLDPTMVAFLADLAQIAVYIVAVVLYAHLIPALRTLRTALLTGMSVVSIILGIAAQDTFGNLVAGIALLLYRPFRVGDHVRIFVPLGIGHGVVERITLGYTFITADDQHRIAGTRIQLTAICADHLGARQVVNDLYVYIPRHFTEAGVVLTTPLVPVRQLGDTQTSSSSPKAILTLPSESYDILDAARVAATSIPPQS